MIDVLVVDDSAFMRRAIASMLERESDMRVVALASSGEEAVELAERLRPHAITMDVEMPGMGGLEAVRRIVAAHHIPIVMLSARTREGAQTTLRALEYGALDFISKPEGAYLDILGVARELVAKVRALATRAPNAVPAAAHQVTEPLTARSGRFTCVAIGTSTGGPLALSHIIPHLPADFPIPVIVVQHMPPGFTRALAERLDAQSAIAVREATDGMPLRGGLVAVAPSGSHLRVRISENAGYVALGPSDGALHVPSVDVTAASVGEAYGAGALGVILTGMGNDGVNGLRTLKERGGYVLGQDAASCVVYGMPRAAAAARLVDRVVPLDGVARAILALTVET